MNFKELRIAQHITLNDTAKNICSVSMLSRWENGQGNMDFKKATKLFERINITPAEFIALNNIDIPDEEALQLKNAWDIKDDQSLKNIALGSLNKFHQHKKIIDLNYAAIACALYQQINGINILSIADQNKLNKQLSKLEIWSQENLSLFRSIMSILSAPIIFQVSYQIIANLDFVEKAGSCTFHFAITTLFESIIHLLKASKINYAQKILAKINTIEFPDSEMQLIVGRSFLNSLITYLNDGDNHEALQIISFLTSLNIKNTASYFLEILNSIAKNKS